MMRSGRFLLLIAGDGIREDVGALAELINRNAALGFSFGLVEVGLYDLGEDGLAIQPRVTARTHILERNVVIYQANGPVAVLRRLAPRMSQNEVRARTKERMQVVQEEPKTRSRPSIADGGSLSST